MRNHSHAAILIAVALIAAGCSSNNTADTTSAESGTTVVETTAPPESTESTIEAEDPVDNPGGLNGSYQLEWDSDELREAFGDLPSEEEFEVFGVAILTFDNGRLETEWQTGPFAGAGQVDTYEVFRDRITIVFPDDEVNAAWVLTDSQLVLSDFTTASGDSWYAVILGTKPLTRLDGPTSASDTTLPESTDSTVEAEDPVVDNPGGLNGSYQLEWDPDELAEAIGEPGFPPESGVIIFTFHNGQLEVAYQTGPLAGEDCDLLPPAEQVERCGADRELATYEVFRDRITIVFRGERMDAAWELTDGQLILSDFTIASGDPFLAAWLGTKPLTRLDGPTSAADTG